MTTLYRNPSLATGATPGPAAATGGPQEPDSRVPPRAAPIAAEISVDGVVIPEEAIRAEAQNHPADNPGEALHAAAEALVIRELLRQEADRLGIAAEPAADAAGRRETADDAAIRALIEREVAAPAATPEECRRYYDRHPEKFRSEPIFEARHILIAAPEGDAATRAAARGKAESLCRQLAGTPAAFADLARAWSDCPSREAGGNLGQITRGSTVAEFETALLSMEEGEIAAAPVESRFGFHVIALDRRIDGRQLPFEHAAERIAAWLEASAWSKAVAQYIAVLAGRATIRGIALKAAEGPLLQ